MSSQVRRLNFSAEITSIKHMVTSKYNTCSDGQEQSNIPALTKGLSNYFWDNVSFKRFGEHRRENVSSTLSRTVPIKTYWTWGLRNWLRSRLLWLAGTQRAQPGGGQDWGSGLCWTHPSAGLPAPHTRPSAKEQTHNVTGYYLRIFLYLKE